MLPEPMMATLVLAMREPPDQTVLKPTRPRPWISFCT
jgi:hypothetical protein